MRLPRATLALPALLLAAAPPENAERLFQEHPSVWFEEYFSTLEITSDGREAIYTSPFLGRVRRIDLRRHRDAGPIAGAGISDLRRAALGPKGRFAMFGTSGGETGWFGEENGKAVRLPLPAEARQPAWSRDGKQVVFVRPEAGDSVFAGPSGSARGYAVGGTITGQAWLPDGRALLALSLNSRGASTLFRVEPASGTVTPVARDLDAPTFTSPVAVAPDGRRAYVALAGATAPSPEVRQQPQAPRQLGIWQIDLATGARHPVVPAAAGTDAYAPRVAAGHLFWIQATTDASIVVVPMAGGEARPVARGGMVPSWRPDGRQIGLVFGEWRWADWALNWDGAVVDVDAEGRAAGAPVPLIVGDHEDFQPVWSPRGRWVAYHSHRPASVIATYGGEGGSDDAWLRRVGAPPRDSTEIRLTDFGIEANSPDWSPDGTRLVFTSWAKDGPRGVSYPFVVTIDTVTGRATGHERVPLPAEIRNTAWVAWSPVGDELALEADDGGGRHSLWIVPIAGGTGRKVVDFPLHTFGGVSWTPDGETLVYTALADGRMQLFAVPATGGAPRQLTRDSANVFTPRVSPDGRLIAATRISHRKEIWRMPLPR